MKKHFFFLALIAGMVLASCGEGNNPQMQSDKATLTPEGATITLKNGVILDVLPGTVQSSTQIEVSYAEDLTNDFGPMPNVQGLITFSPEGMVFDKAIGVTMPLNEPVRSNTTSIVYWSEIDNTWYITDIGTIKDGKVSFFVEHFSSYASVGCDWSRVFAQMDAAVGSLTDEDAISSAVQGVLSSAWEDIDGLRIATTVSTGNTCAKICGLFGFWLGEKNGETRQGGGTYKNKSKQNIIVTLGLSDHAATSHLQGELEIGGSQENVSRTLELYFDPCKTELAGEAESSVIEVGKTTKVTIQASCGGTPLAGQLLQFSCTPELSINVRSQKTDANGEVTITVKGEQEGKGSLHVTAASAADLDLVSEIDVPIKVGAAEWEVEWSIHVTKTAHLVSVDKYNERIPLRDDVRGYTYTGDTKSVSFIVVGSARFKTGTTYHPEAGQEVGVIRGTANVRIDPSSVEYDYPDWVSTWEEWQEIELRNSTVEKVRAKRRYEFTYEPHYTLYPRENVEFVDYYVGDRVTIDLDGNDDDKYGTCFKDSTTFTMTLTGTDYYYTLNRDETAIESTEEYAYPTQTVTDRVGASLGSMIYPSSILFTLEEGTFPLYDWNDDNADLLKDHVYFSADLDFHTQFSSEALLPYNGYPEIETSQHSVGEITVRMVTPEEE